MQPTDQMDREASIPLPAEAASASADTAGSTGRATLRILQVNSRLTGGGIDSHCIMLADGLGRLGHRVWLAGPGDRTFAAIARERGLAFHETPAAKPTQMRLISSAAKLIKSERIQIVHAHHGRDIWPAILAAKLSGRNPKIVVTRHMAKSPASWASRWLLLGRCDALVAVSDFTAKILREGVYEPESPEPERRARPPMAGDVSKIRVLLGGIDTDRFRPFDAAAKRREWGLAPEHFAFAVVGGCNLPRGKGQREFLQAAARIQAELPNARFLIIGDGNLRPILEDDIRQLGLGHKASLVAHCHDVPAAMNAIDCLVHPAVGTEAFGLVISEAHACGKPVIATELDGIPEAFRIGGYGQLIPPEDVAALAAAMRSWGARAQHEHMQARELHARVAAELSIPAFARRAADLYDSILPVDAVAALRRVPYPRSASAAN